MKVKRFYILFMCILYMCTTTISCFADTYGCVTASKVEGTNNYYIDTFELSGNDHVVLLNVLGNYEYYSVSFNGKPTRIEYNEGYIYTLMLNRTVYFVFSNEYFVSGRSYEYSTYQIGIQINLNNTSNMQTSVFGQGDYVSTYVDILNNYYDITNLSSSNLVIQQQFSICNTNNILERSPVFMAVITAILAVFSAIGDWFVDIIPTVLSVFWTPGVDGADGSLTIIGALAVASLAIAVILLVLRWIVEFFRFRG